MPNPALLHPTLFARTTDGIELPVLDITSPTFAVELHPAELPAELARFVVEETNRQRVPGWLLGLFLRIAGRRSYLIRAMAAARGRGYLPSLTTYFLKLGAANLPPPLDNDIDRKIVSSLPARSLRLRLEQVARLLAEALEPLLAEMPGAPLHLLDIAGGPALDALNTLLLIKANHPELLAARTIVIHVLDIEATGPAFGRNALAALQDDAAPLHGVAAEIVHLAWDWRDLSALDALLRELAAQGAIVAASSEGGLFEYGSDAEIQGVLLTLAAGTGPTAIVAGSVTKDDPPTRLFTRRSMFPIVPRGAARFGDLAASCGWKLAELRPAAFSEQILLRKS